MCSYDVVQEADDLLPVKKAGQCIRAVASAFYIGSGPVVEKVKYEKPLYVVVCGKVLQCLHESLGLQRPARAAKADLS
jgi:hypothetical protein